MEHPEGATPGGGTLLFWTWFDQLPKAERDRINAAKTQDEVIWLVERAWALFPYKAE